MWGQRVSSSRSSGVVTTGRAAPLLVPEDERLARRGRWGDGGAFDTGYSIRIIAAGSTYRTWHPSTKSALNVSTMPRSVIAAIRVLSALASSRSDTDQLPKPSERNFAPGDEFVSWFCST
jgi:hypothetical protein